MNKDHKTPGGVQIGVTEDNVTRITAVFHKCRVAVESYFASRLRCSTAEAKELAQETYTALIRRRKRREVEDWEGLLWCSARNRAMNKLRQRRFRQEQDVLMFLDLETEDHRTPETWLTQEQTSAAIERAIARRPNSASEACRRRCVRAAVVTASCRLAPCK